MAGVGKSPRIRDAHGYDIWSNMLIQFTLGAAGGGWGGGIKSGSHSLWILRKVLCSLPVAAKREAVMEGSGGP